MPRRRTSADAGTAVSQPRLFARAVMSQGNHSLFALAIVVISYVVAAAHFYNMPRVHFRTDLRDSRAGALHVDHTALSGFLLTKQAGVT